jgi:hypothetical protein
MPVQRRRVDTRSVSARRRGEITAIMSHARLVVRCRRHARLDGVEPRKARRSVG